MAWLGLPLLTDLILRQPHVQREQFKKNTWMDGLMDGRMHGYPQPRSKFTEGMNGNVMT